MNENTIKVLQAQIDALEETLRLMCPSEKIELCNGATTNVIADEKLRDLFYDLNSVWLYLNDMKGEKNNA